MESHSGISLYLIFSLNFFDLMDKASQNILCNERIFHYGSKDLKRSLYNFSTDSP